VYGPNLKVKSVMKTLNICTESVGMCFSEKYGLNLIVSEINSGV